MYSDHDVQRQQQDKAMKHREKLCRVYEKRATNKFPKIPAVNSNGNDIIRLDISNGDMANEATMLQRNNITLIVWSLLSLSRSSSVKDRLSFALLKYVEHEYTSICTKRFYTCIILNLENKSLKILLVWTYYYSYFFFKQQPKRHSSVVISDPSGKTGFSAHAFRRWAVER